MSIANSQNLASGQEFYSDFHCAAVELAELGLPVFPCIEGGKEPLTPDGFKNRTIDRATIDAWWQVRPQANVAIVPEDGGYAVIDVEAPGLAQLDEFRQGLELPRTFTNRTPRGGEHRFYAGSVQSLVRPFKRADGGKFDLDTRGRGGYVLMPPSRTADGEYTTKEDIDAEPLPQWIAAKLAARKHDRQVAATNLEYDLRDNVRRGRIWLEAQPVPVEGERNAKTFVAACRLKDLGIGAQTILDMLLTWAPLSDDFTAEEVEGRVISAFENGQNEPGCYAVTSSAEAFANFNIAAANAGSQPVATGEDLPPIEFEQGDKLLDEQPEATEWLIDGLVEKGEAVMLAGPGGVHKSRTALHWGLAVSEGIEVYGRKSERATFVYLSYEDVRKKVKNRMHLMTKRLAVTWGSNMHYRDMTDRSGEFLLRVTGAAELEPQPLYLQLRKYLRGIDGHKFVVLDSTYNVLKFSGNAKIDDGAVNDAVKFLRHLGRETDSTIMFLWHPSYSGQARGDNSGWSTAWHDAPRAKLSLSRRDKGRDTFELVIEKASDAATGLAHTLHWDNGILAPQTGPAREHLFEACVRVALQAAELGTPILKRTKLAYWQVHQIEQECGFKPTEAQIKTELENAIPLKRLRYINGKSKTKAGYFPFGAEDIGGEIIIHKPEGEKPVE